jgi:hypothetical protein
MLGHASAGALGRRAHVQEVGEKEAENEAVLRHLHMTASLMRFVKWNFAAATALRAAHLHQGGKRE